MREWTEPRGPAYTRRGARRHVNPPPGWRSRSRCEIGFVPVVAAGDPATADGVEFDRIGPNRVAVPTHLLRVYAEPALVASRVPAVRSR